MYQCLLVFVMRTYFRIMLLVFIMAAVAVGSIDQVSADTCSIKPSSIAYTASQYNYYTSGVVVPVSVTCLFVGGQLYAVGTAIDTSTNARVGSVGAALSSAYGTNIYTGRLVFSVPPQVTGHALQVSISIYFGTYNGYTNGSPLATSVETMQVNSNNYYFNYANCYYNSNCGFNSPGNYNQLQCPSLTMNNTVQCVGVLYQNANSCVILVIPVYSPIGLVSNQYYTLQQLPSSYPSIGTWVSVSGQLNRGSNLSSTGAACPGNYINVASITNSTAAHP